MSDYDYEADIARGSNIRKPGERPWEAAQRMKREHEWADFHCYVAGCGALVVGQLNLHYPHAASQTVLACQKHTDILKMLAP